MSKYSRREDNSEINRSSSAKHVKRPKDQLQHTCTSLTKEIQRLCAEVPRLTSVLLHKFHFNGSEYLRTRCGYMT